MPIRIALPSKGRMMDGALDWLRTCGLDVADTDNEREYANQVKDVENLQVNLLSASDIPSELASGRVHLGVTGMDVVRENIPTWETSLRELRPLGFGRADLVLAVPKIWIDVVSLHDLDEVAAQFRENHGRRLRIATKYHNLVRRFLSANGVANYQLVHSRGATEGAVSNQTAEAVADITSTGKTLEANGLKPLSGHPILMSEAMLYQSVTADWSSENPQAIGKLSQLLGIDLFPE